MTGFGAAAREAAGTLVRAEVRSVNHRSLDVKLRAPAFLDAHATALEAAVRRHVTRGAVTVALTVQRSRNAAPSRIAAAVVTDYAQQADALADELHLAPPSMGDLLRLPGALEDAPATDLGAAELATVLQALDAALADLAAMREREGATLAEELRGLVAQLDAHATSVAVRSPESVRAQHAKLRERLAQLLAPGQGVPEELVAREIAVLADRTDVAEEVARLRSHVQQGRQILDEGGAVGRRLDFLAQELGRETNTVGSKCQDAEITRTVLEMKLVVERLKEQAANLE